ncbi:MAG: LysR family transcriptional regulator [Betaproteobacteria bacterium]|jgi:DNA-binding transcriptional LysR family regulator|nr:LysR family transcriptional regulator [Betaproteobacteria bacterium]
MTLVQLKHFVALAEAGSFSKAATRVFLTQPALSRSIQALEDEWGARLFDRVGRRIELTPYGLEMLPRAQRLLSDAQELQRTGREFTSAEAGALRIGLGSGPGAMLMAPLLLTMAREHPQLHLDIARSGTELLAQALRERRLDALVVDARSLRPASDLKTEFHHEMRGAFMVRRGHPLAKRMAGTRALAFHELAPYPIASTPLSDEVARIMVERYGPQANPSECVTLRCEEISSLVEVVEHSDAVLVAIRQAAPKLVELRLRPALQATARFGLVTLADRTEHPALAVVRRVMQDRLRDPPPQEH